MISYRWCILAAAGLVLAACAPKASITGTITGAGNSEIVVRQLNINVYNTADTIKTDASGRFKYKMNIEKGQPEFIYLFYSDKRVAGLLLESGDKVEVQADTLGNYTVSGSEASNDLAQVDKAYAKFITDINAKSDDASAMAKIYVDHYRASVKYLLTHPYSLTTVPVLFQRMGDASIFAQSTDALIFQTAADSLMTVYPESRYVKALSKEADRRLKLLEVERQLGAAEEMDYPELNLPDINGHKKSLSSIEAKVILVHFWNTADVAQKMLNIDTLLPIYNDYHSKGFEIYSVGIGVDKADWGASVSSQNLPWINVCDGLGTASVALAAYNVGELPTSILITDGNISTLQIKGEAGLRKELDKLFRR